jgi:hypothetical protein
LVSIVFLQNYLLGKISDASQKNGISPRELLKQMILASKSDKVEVTKEMILTNDATPVYQLEKDCNFEQVATYGYDNEIGNWNLRVSKEIFNSDKFSNTDRAALLIHEAIYTLDRQFNGATNSQRTRRIIMDLFSARDTLKTGLDLNEVLRVDLVNGSYQKTEKRNVMSVYLNGRRSPEATARFGKTLGAKCTLSITRNGESVFYDHKNIVMDFDAQQTHFPVRNVTLKPGLYHFDYSCVGPMYVPHSSATINSVDVTALLFERKDILNPQESCQVLPTRDGSELICAPVNFEKTILIKDVKSQDN